MNQVLQPSLPLKCQLTKPYFLGDRMQKFLAVSHLPKIAVEKNIKPPKNSLRLDPDVWSSLNSSLCGHSQEFFDRQKVHFHCFSHALGSR